MDLVYEELNECIAMSRRLQMLQNEDEINICKCIKGEQAERYQQIMHEERDKLAHLEQRLQSLLEEQMSL